MLVRVIVNIINTVLIDLCPLQHDHCCLPLFKLLIDFFLFQPKLFPLFLDPLLILLAFRLKDYSFDLALSQKFFLFVDEVDCLFHFGLSQFVALVVVVGSLSFE